MRNHNRSIVLSHQTTGEICRFARRLFVLGCLTALLMPAAHAQYGTTTGSSSSRSSSSRYGSRSTSTGSAYGSSYGGAYGSQYGSSSGSAYGGSYDSSMSSFDSYDQSGYPSSSRSSRLSGRSSSRSSRSDVTSAQEKAKTDKATGQAETPEKARLQGKSTVAKSKKAAKAIKTGGGGKAEALPEVKLNPELHANALYFSPTMRHVRPGDRFVSTISFYNDKKDKADAADLWIQFDPRFIEPEWIDAAPLEKVAAAPPEMKVWGEQGFIRIKAAITGPLIEAVNPLATIHWRALAEVPSTRIELTAPPGESVSLLAKGKNIIPAGLAGSNARVDMLVRVALPAPETPGLRLVDDARRMLPAPPLEPGRRLRLAIVAPEREIPPGGVATADVVLLNPEREAFDDLKLRIRFDPQAVEVLDADEDNYITGGTNIFDGDFHEAFPFTSLGENRVDPAHGVISYRMGSTSGPMECGSGVVARIVYRMKRQSGWTAFWFERDDPLAPAPATDVAADGRSLLGPTRAIAAQALHGVQIPVGVGAAAGS